MSAVSAASTVTGVMPPTELAWVLETVKRTFEEGLFLFQEDAAWKDRTGGYFCLADLRGMPLLIAPIGTMSREKAEKYLQLCQEKARRLSASRGHISSWESRVPDEEKYGGAITIADVILSFSGLPEKGDEAVMMVAGALFAQRKSEGAGTERIDGVCRAVRMKSQNGYIEPLLKYVRHY
jgi:hypothetical protein